MFVSKAMLCFLKNIWLRYGDYDSKITSKSSNTKNAALHMQFLIFNGRTNDCKCVLRYFMLEYLDAFLYLLDGNDYIDFFFFNADIHTTF